MVSLLRVIEDAQTLVLSGEKVLITAEPLERQRLYRAWALSVEDLRKELPDGHSLEVKLSIDSLESDLQVLSTYLARRDQLRVAAPTNSLAVHRKRVFISYAHEDDDYNARVRQLAEHLAKDGLDVRLDQWHLTAGHNVVEFMTSEIRHADYVLVLCSPKFARKTLEAEDGQGPTGLVWEKRLITTVMENDPQKVIPVLGRGTWKVSAPSILQGLLYIDLSTRETFAHAYRDLLRRLGGAVETAPLNTRTPPQATAGGSVSRPTWPTCSIVITCARRAASWETLRQIKKWLNDNARDTADVSPTLFSLPQAIESARGAATILLALGFNKEEVLAVPLGSERKDLEVVCVPSPVPHTDSYIPSASLIDPGRISVVEGDPVPFVRKALLRSCASQVVSVRNIQTDQELAEYFALRYRVWAEQGYLARGEASLDTPWEIDYTDRTSVALGVYTSGELVACARLVYGLGEEDRSVVATIEQLLVAKGGTSLLRRLTIPPGMPPQFDILGAFRGFPAYYRQLVTDRVAKAEVSRVIVAPEYRKHGLGEVLVDSLAALADRRQLDLLFLACRQSHRSFYERCAFQVIPNMVCDRFINQDEPSIAMERRLGSLK
jgi:predicted GNAT family N-acyltransferase